MTLADLSQFSMKRPRSLDELCSSIAERVDKGLESVLLAGGTDFIVEQELRPPVQAERLPMVFDISRMADLRGIGFAEGRLRIGAAATYLEILRHADVVRHAPLLARASRELGAIQIQARGTLGGNLATASPAADGVAALAAYDAVLVVRSVRGERRIAFRDLQTGYKQSTRAKDEVFVAIEIDTPSLGSEWAWRKVGARRAQAISKVAFAAVAELKNGYAQRLGFGLASVAPITARLPKTQEALVRRPLREFSREQVEALVASDIAPIDDVRSTREYRIHCAKALVWNWISDLSTR